MSAHWQRQDGNASLLVVVMGAGVLLTVLSQSQGVVSERLKASKVKKSTLEAQESDLFALSITKQLISSGAQPLPAVGFRNPLNPMSLQDIGLRPLQANPNPSDVSIQPDGTLRVVAADVNRLSTQDIDQIFQTKNFDLNVPKTNITVRMLGWDPFPNGYGVQTLYVEAQTSITQSGDRHTALRAKVPMNPPPGDCVIVATSGGTPVTAGSTVPAGSSVDVNLHCQGVVLDARLFDNSTEIGKAGPGTAARDYTSNIPRLLPSQPSLQIAATGYHTLSAVVNLVNGTQTDVDDFTFRVESVADPLVCRTKCTCTSWTNGPKCENQTNFADPYPRLAANAALPAPLPTLSGNPQTSQTDYDRLQNWAGANGMYEPGALWQGAAYPNYGDILVCADATTDFEFWGFDPANNCTGTKISERGVLGCFREGTLITVKPGVVIPIENLRPGDFVWNPLQQRSVRLTKVVAGPEDKPLLRIRLADRAITVTGGHPMRTPAGYAKASDMKAGDLLMVNNRWQKVFEITADASRPRETVWNVAIAPGPEVDDGAIEAEGIVVGDLNLQYELDGKVGDGH